MEKFDKILNYLNFYALIIVSIVCLIGAIQWLCVPNIISALFYGVIAWGSAWIASSFEELKEPRKQLVSFIKTLIAKFKK